MSDTYLVSELGSVLNEKFFVLTPPTPIDTYAYERVTK